jgi:hypothetical protein
VKVGKICRLLQPGNRMAGLLIVTFFSKGR